MWCVPLGSVGRDDVATAGGKGANLGELIRAGFQVPAGFVVTTDAYRHATDAVRRAAGDVRAAAVPRDLAEAIAASYAEIGGGPVAVRSSATAEDLPGAAFAGQQETYLNVIGNDAVVAAVRDCWASLWSERAVAYRARLGIDPGAVAIAVVVQRLVPADLAGVMFTANPVTGSREDILIDSSPGLGEAVVSGAVTPDHAVLDRGGRVVSRVSGRAEQAVVAAAAGGTRSIEAAADAVASDELLGRIARLGVQIERHFGVPQDIEWAVRDEEVFVLQARPMTALPPPVRRLGWVQRWFGSVLVELLPRRPLPLELTGWILPVMGPVITGMYGAILGLRLDLSQTVTMDDGVGPSSSRRRAARPGRRPSGWRSCSAGSSTRARPYGARIPSSASTGTASDG